VLSAFEAQRTKIDTTQPAKAPVSDAVLKLVAPGLEAAGFQVEASKRREHRLHRPVFYGDNGQPSFAYRIDAYHAGERIALEVEAGRGAQSNAVYRDLIQQSHMVDVEYGVVALPCCHRPKDTTPEGMKGLPVYQKACELLDAVYGGPRLALPFKGFLLIGY
jgi:hypothetical protein